MNYQRIYNNIVERAKNRDLPEYTEVHHIIPRCLGGSDDIVNLVNLTPEEHYLAHLLLVKIHPDEPGLAYAANLMANRMKFIGYTNKKYGIARRAVAKAMREREVSEETKRKISEAQIGRKARIATREKMSRSHKGKKFSKEHKEIISRNQKKMLENGTHNFSGKQPWEAPNAIKNPKWWAKADILYTMWLKDPCGDRAMSTRLGFKGQRFPSIYTILKKFEEGWIPLEDEYWKNTFKINTNHK